jgi:hypothetical protein
MKEGSWRPRSRSSSGRRKYMIILRKRYRVVTMSLLAQYLRQENVSLKELSIRSVRRRVWHLMKQCVVWSRVRRVAQKTQYYQNVKNAYVSYINEQINIGRYRPEYIVSMDKTNFDFDQEAGDVDHCLISRIVSIRNCCFILDYF